MLSKLADVLEINVSELLGSEIKEETNKNEVAEQLAKISEQLALKNRRHKRDMESYWSYIVSCDCY